MRWQRLFDDLEAQVEQADQAMLEAEVADRTRREMARVRLADRLRASVGVSTVVRLIGLGPLTAIIEAVGPDWMLVAERAGTETLMPLHAVLGVTGLARKQRYRAARAPSKLGSASAMPCAASPGTGVPWSSPSPTGRRCAGQWIEWARTHSISLKPKLGTVVVVWGRPDKQCLLWH